MRSRKVTRKLTVEKNKQKLTLHNRREKIESTTFKKQTYKK